SLTPLEIELVTAWTDGGAPLGPAIAKVQHAHAALPARPADLVLNMPTPAAVTALTMRYDLPSGLATDRWVGAWEFRPGNRSLIEEAVLWIAPTTLLGRWTPPERLVAYPSGVAK